MQWISSKCSYVGLFNYLITTSQITPSEIEDVIESIDGVQFVAVVGIPDPDAFEVPAAVVVKKKGFESLTEEKIINYVAENLPRTKHLLGGAYFIDEFPTTISGKTRKIALREIVINRRKITHDKIQ